MPHTPSMIAALDAEIFFDAGKQRRVLLGFLPAGDDAPVGDAAVEVLPELFVEFGLVADRLKPGHVGTHPRMTRVYVSAVMPRAIAFVRNASIH